MATCPKLTAIACTFHRRLRDPPATQLETEQVHDRFAPTLSQSHPGRWCPIRAVLHRHRRLRNGGFVHKSSQHQQHPHRHHPDRSRFRMVSHVWCGLAQQRQILGREAEGRAWLANAIDWNTVLPLVVLTGSVFAQEKYAHSNIGPPPTTTHTLNGGDVSNSG